MITIWRILLLVLAVVVAWRIVAIGLSDHYAEQLRNGDADAMQQLLTWQADHPLGLLTKAIRLLAEDRAAAMQLLAQAYEADPTNPRPLTLAARPLLEQQAVERADGLMEVAVALAPATPWVLKDGAAYWAARDQAARSLAQLSTVLVIDASARRELFPVLVKVAEDPQSRSLLLPLADSPPSWWTGFFVYAARSLEPLDALRALYNARRGSDIPPLSPEERAAYVARLRREQHISEAYVVWVNGLSAAEQQHLGLLFNGGFELPLAGAGFGWHTIRSDHVRIRPMATVGATGKQALRLQFRAWKRRFRHLYQPLFLDPGTYRLSGRVRTDGFESQGGLRWEVRCLEPAKPLAAGARLLSAPEWQSFDLGFEVPNDCSHQQLQLVSAGRRPFELRIVGALWLDDLRIVRTEGLDVAAKADQLVEPDMR